MVQYCVDSTYSTASGQYLAPLVVVGGDMTSTGNTGYLEMQEEGLLGLNSSFSLLVGGQLTMWALTIQDYVWVHNSQAYFGDWDFDFDSMPKLFLNASTVEITSQIDMQAQIYTEASTLIIGKFLQQYVNNMRVSQRATSLPLDLARTRLCMLTCGATLPSF